MLVQFENMKSKKFFVRFRRINRIEELRVNSIRKIIFKKVDNVLEKKLRFETLCNVSHTRKDIYSDKFGTMDPNIISSLK